MAMMAERLYQDGSRVDVWRKNRGAWVEGTVYGYEEKDGVGRYFVQLAGYMAMQASDPNSWFAADELRPATGLDAGADDI
jgi:hypothetical protein